MVRADRYDSTMTAAITPTSSAPRMTKSERCASSTGAAATSTPSSSGSALAVWVRSRVKMP